MKKFVIILLIAALVLSLTGCSSASDPNLGVYEARKASMKGVSLNVSEVYEGGFSVELKSGNKAVLHIDGEDYNLKWELEGTRFHLIAADTEFYGTLKDGTMKLPDFQGSGVDVTLVCDTVAAAAAADKPRTASSFTDYWAGRWYGWRVNYSGWGEYADYEDQAFDVLADITVDGKTGSVTIWDQEDERDEAFIVADARFEDGLTDAGKMILTSGVAFSGELPQDGMEIDPGDSTVSTLDHMIELHGIFVGEGDNGFEYYIFLRPWGMRWEDVEKAESEDFLYADMMPVSYDDWYLTQIK